MFTITCFVNAFCTPTPRAFRFVAPPSLLIFGCEPEGEAARVDGCLGDPSFVWYPGGCSSSRSDCASSIFAYPPLSQPSKSRSTFLKCFKIHLPASSPTSRLCFFTSCVSSRKRMPITTPTANTTAQTRLGRRNGNRSKIVLRANIEG